MFSIPRLTNKPNAQNYGMRHSLHAFSVRRLKRTPKVYIGKRTSFDGTRCVCLAAMVGDQIHALAGLGAGEVGDEQDVVYIIFLNKLDQIIAAVLAVVQCINLVVVLGEEGDEAVAEGVLDNHTAGAIGEGIVGDDADGVIAGQEGQILGVDGPLGAVLEQGHLVAAGGVGVDHHGDVALRDIGVYSIGLQLMGAVALAVDTAVEITLVDHIVVADADYVSMVQSGIRFQDVMLI